VVGTLHQIRSEIYTIKGVQENVWEFTDDLEGWNVDVVGGTVTHVDGIMKFKVTGEIPQVSKHVSAWQAEDLRYLWISLRNETAADSGAFSFFYDTGDSARIVYPLTSNDTQYRDIMLDLDSNDFWPGDTSLNRFRLYPAMSHDTGTVFFDFIRFLADLIRIRPEGNVNEIKGIGNTLQLYAEEIPAMNAIAVDWSVDLPGVATVDGNGLLTGVSDGIVTVRAMAKDGSGKSGTLRISITDTSQKTSWEFTEDLEGWDKNVQGGSVSWSDGALKFTVSGPDPYVYKNVAPWKVKNLKYLWIRVRNETSGAGGAMYLFPSGGGHDFVPIPITQNDSEYRDILVDMRKAGIWDKDLVLDNLRLDPNNGGENGVVYVDFIRFLEEPLAVTPEVDEANIDGIPGIGIYPNPAGDFLHFSQPTDILSIDIFDLTGQVVKEVFFRQDNKSLNIGSLPPGIYLLRTLSADGQKNTYRFVKK
jgi:hypothetical protein